MTQVLEPLDWLPQGQALGLSRGFYRGFSDDPQMPLASSIPSGPFTSPTGP